ncbi:MAG: hypothetical protein WA821_16400 [Anaerolineales bacterium]
MSKCSECSKLQPTCCENTEICVTNGDIKRIAVYIGRNDFYHLMPVAEEMKYFYENPFNITKGSEIYIKCLFDEDGRRNILKKNGNRCGFLTPVGCELPLNVRPIICRLHPYNWNDNKDIWLEPHCPESLFKDEQEIKEQVCLPEEEVTRLVDLFYDEIMNKQESIS